MDSRTNKLLAGLGNCVPMHATGVVLATFAFALALPACGESKPAEEPASVMTTETPPPVIVVAAPAPTVTAAPGASATVVAPGTTVTQSTTTTTVAH